MSVDKVRDFIKAVKTNEELSKVAREKTEGKSPDEVIKYYAELAPTMDFDVTEEDLRECFINEPSKLQQRTDATIAKVQELDINELDEVAGGYADSPECADTYRDHENCWYNDGCNVIFNRYRWYKCGGWFNDD